MPDGEELEFQHSASMLGMDGDLYKVLFGSNVEDGMRGMKA